MPIDQSWHFPVAIEEVIDGDTLRGTIEVWPNTLIRTAIRVRNINAPETFQPKCPAEKAAGEAAKAEAASFVLNATHIDIANIGIDKYGGRVDARVTVDGEDLGQHLLGLNLVIPYGAKKPWCPGASKRK